MKKLILLPLLAFALQVSASIPPVSVAKPTTESNVRLSPPDEYLTHSEAGVKVLVPSGWKQEKEDNLLVINSPDGNVEIFFLVIDAADFETAVNALDEELNKVIRNATFEDKVEELTLDGMSAISLDGVGIDDETNVKVELSVTVIDCPKNNKFMFLVGAGTPASLQKNEAALVKIFSGLKKA